MSAGAFSDDKVIEASKKLVCIFVDCNWGQKNQDVSGKYAVRGYPTVVFTDPDGKEVDRMKGRDAATVAAQIEKVAGNNGKK